MKELENLNHDNLGLTTVASCLVWKSKLLICTTSTPLTTALREITFSFTAVSMTRVPSLPRLNLVFKGDIRGSPWSLRPTFIVAAGVSRLAVTLTILQ